MQRLQLSFSSSSWVRKLTADWFQGCGVCLLQSFVVFYCRWPSNILKIHVDCLLWWLMYVNTPYHPTHSINIYYAYPFLSFYFSSPHCLSLSLLRSFHYGEAKVTPVDNMTIRMDIMMTEWKRVSLYFMNCWGFFKILKSEVYQFWIVHAYLSLGSK